MDVEAMADEADPAVVVQVEVAEEEMEEDKVTIPVAELVANTPSKPLLLPPLLQRITKIRTSVLNNIISIKLEKIPIGHGMPMIKRQQVNKPLLK
jgi:hypothetical protein